MVQLLDQSSKHRHLCRLQVQSASSEGRASKATMRHTLHTEHCTLHAAAFVSWCLADARPAEKSGQRSVSRASDLKLKVVTARMPYNDLHARATLASANAPVVTVMLLHVAAQTAQQRWELGAGHEGAVDGDAWLAHALKSIEEALKQAPAHGSCSGDLHSCWSLKCKARLQTADCLI